MMGYWNGSEKDMRQIKVGSVKKQVRYYYQMNKVEKKKEEGRVNVVIQQKVGRCGYEQSSRSMMKEKVSKGMQCGGKEGNEEEKRERGVKMMIKRDECGGKRRLLLVLREERWKVI